MAVWIALATGQTARIRLDSSWDHGSTATVWVTAGNRAISGWTVRWTWPREVRPVATWGFRVSSGTPFVAQNAPWNGALPAGATATVGYLADGPGHPRAASCTAW